MRPRVGAEEEQRVGAPRIRASGAFPPSVPMTRIVAGSDSKDPSWRAGGRRPAREALVRLVDAVRRRRGSRDTQATVRRTSPTRATPTQSAMRRRRGGRAPVRAPASTWVASSARGDLALDAAAAVQPVGLVSHGHSARYGSPRPWRTHVIGVDVGGTKILAGVVDRDGNVLRSREVDSPSASEEDVVAALDASVEALLDEDVAAVGFGVGEPRAGHRTHPPGDESPVRRLRPRRARARDSAFPWASRTTRTPPPSRSGGSARVGASRACSCSRWAPESAAGSCWTTGCTAAGRRSATWSSRLAGRRARGTATGTGTSRPSPRARRRTPRRATSTGRGPTRGRWWSGPGRGSRRPRPPRSDRRLPRAAIGSSRTSSTPSSWWSGAASARLPGSSCSARRRGRAPRGARAGGLDAPRRPCRARRRGGLVGAALVAFEALDGARCPSPSARRRSGTSQM